MWNFNAFPFVRYKVHFLLPQGEGAVRRMRGLKRSRAASHHLPVQQTDCAVEELSLAVRTLA